MIYTLTLNPSLDYVMEIEKFVPGQINRTTEERIRPGGKGINVSVMLKNLGYDNTALGFIGGFTGVELECMLKERGIFTDFIRVETGITRMNVKLCSTEETEVNGKGPMIGESHLKCLFEKLDLLTEGDILILSGSLPKGISNSIYMDIIKYLKNKKLKIVVDAVRETLLDTLPYSPFLIKPNHHELGELFGVKIQKKEDAIIYAKKLKEMGAENVLVSMAGNGAILLAKDRNIYKMEAPKGIVKNSVGAGDSMVAGFLVGYMEKGNYKEALCMGVCAGSASAFSEELANREQVVQLMERIKDC